MISILTFLGATLALGIISDGFYFMVLFDSTDS